MHRLMVYRSAGDVEPGSTMCLRNNFGKIALGDGGNCFALYDHGSVNCVVPVLLGSSTVENAGHTEWMSIRSVVAAVLL